MYPLEPCCEPRKYSEKDHIRDLQKENEHLYEQIREYADGIERLRLQNEALRTLLKEIL